MADGEAVEKVHLDVILSAREGSGVVKRLENRDSSLRSEWRLVVCSDFFNNPTDTCFDPDTADTALRTHLRHGKLYAFNARLSSAVLSSLPAR